MYLRLQMYIVAGMKISKKITQIKMEIKTT